MDCHRRPRNYRLRPAVAAVLGLVLTAWGRPALAAPAAQLDPVSVAFPNRMVGTASYEVFIHILNTGTDPLTVHGMSLGGAHPKDFGLRPFCGPLPAVLQPGQQCAAQVHFQPRAVGPRTALLLVETNAPGTPHQAVLTGNGLAPAPVLSVGGPLTFPDTVVTQTSPDQNVLLMNNGLADLHISSITITGSAAADFQKDTYCDTQTLTAGYPTNFCYFGVRFRPQQGGLRQAQIVIVSDDASSPHVIGLSGQGLQGILQVTPSPLAFGTVYGGSTSTRTLTLENVGTAGLTITGVSVTGSFAAEFQVPSGYTCVVWPGSTCGVSVTFAPRAVGTRVATLQVTTYGGGTTSVTLTGTGQFPPAPAPGPTDDRTFLRPGVMLQGTCRVGSQGPLTFGLPIGRAMGSVAAAVASGVLRSTAELEIAGYNVDAPPPNGPVVTRHDVKVNGTAVGVLRGYASNWWVTRLTVPVTSLAFPVPAPIGSVPVPANNTVTIDVDTTNVGNRGCLAVAWARLQVKALSPVVLVHGNGSNGGFFARQGLVAGLTAAGAVVDSSITLPGGSMPIASNALALQAALPPVARSFGVSTDSLHLVAHSKGGLDARSWLGTFGTFNAFRVLSLTTLSTPHRGSALADAAMAVRATGLGVPGLPIATLGFIGFGAGVPNLTTSFTASFNPPLPPAADYRMLGADTDFNGDGFILSTPFDEYLAAHTAPDGSLAPVFATSPAAADALATTVYQFLRNVGSVGVAPMVLPLPFPPFFVIVTVPVPIPFGGGLNDLLVTTSSANGAPAPFVSLGNLRRDHASVANGATAAFILPSLIATDATRGDLR